MILQNEEFGSRTRRVFINLTVAFSLLIILSGFVVAQSKDSSNLTLVTSNSFSLTNFQDLKVRRLLPDLKVRQFLFVPRNDKGLRVQVSNNGTKVSVQCRLELTVRKINGTAVGRTMNVDIPAIAPGQAAWLSIDTSSILPKNVSLKDTTFKLIADTSKIVAESDENNNEVWHNLN